jgi:hypothetical protein
MRREGGAGWRSEDQRAVLEAESPILERIRGLLTHPQAAGVAFQSVLVSSIQILEEVLAYQREIARSAISLAQREKNQEMVSQLKAIIEMLSGALNDQGHRMLMMRPPTELVKRNEDAWWYLLAEGAEKAEQGAIVIAQIVSGQPRGNPARTLSSILARLLHRHHRHLITEAQSWRS